MRLMAIKILILSLLLGVHYAHAEVRLWVSASATDGLIGAGGRAGADAFCDGDANNPSIPASTTRAFISVDAADEIRDMPANYNIPTNETIFQVDGATQIAPNFSALLDAGTTPLTNVILGGLGATSVYTGSVGDGSLSIFNCAGWTDNTGGSGQTGVSNQTNQMYITSGSATCNGAFPVPLYCITFTAPVDNDNLPDLLECPTLPNNCPDRDMDGRADYQDVDSDNDNIPDIVEAFALLDTDNDGIGNGLDIDDPSDPARVDANMDGIDDRMPSDIDGDGVPNHLDTDSDNDGTSDDQDTPLTTTLSGTDTDGDGIDDNYDFNHSSVTGATNVDADGDGYDDGIIATLYSEANPSADADDIPDIFDADQDNTAATSDLSGDSDGDGLSDLTECPVFSFQATVNCPDSDQDGVPDFLDTDTDPVSAPRSSGSGSIAPIFLIALLWLMLFRKRNQ